MREYGVFLDGKFLTAASGQTSTSTDPSNGEQVAIVAKAGKRDARRAIDAARRAFDAGSWAALSVEQRRDALLGVCDRLQERFVELAELEARDTGMPIRLAQAMIGAGIQQARELVRAAAAIPMIEQIRHPEYELPAQQMLVRDPYGVVSAITPFNAPFVLAVWKVFPALAMGNAVVLKPAPATPCSTMEMAVAFSESDVPPGIFNVLPGADVDAGEEMVTNPLVDRVAFTGSTETGRKIAALAAQTIKRVTLELGGKGANILLDDADLDVAVGGSLWGMYLHAGQTCQAATRLFVPEHLHDEVVDRLVAGATQLRIGPTLSPDTDLGPIATQAQLQRVERYVAIGRTEGAQLVCGGRRLSEDGLDKGFYYAPTIFTGVTNSMRIAQEEIFGPVLSVISYRSLEDAVTMANDTPYGLTAGVWGRDRQRALTTALRLQAGTVWVNDWHTVTTAAPYGGYKQSGLGKELGVQGCLEYAQSKHVWIDHSPDGEPRVWHHMLGIDRRAQ